MSFKEFITLFGYDTYLIPINIVNKQLPIKSEKPFPFCRLLPYCKETGVCLLPGKISILRCDHIKMAKCWQMLYFFIIIFSKIQINYLNSTMTSRKSNVDFSLEFGKNTSHTPLNICIKKRKPGNSKTRICLKH